MITNKTLYIAVLMVGIIVVDEIWIKIILILFQLFVWLTAKDDNYGN